MHKISIIALIMLFYTNIFPNPNNDVEIEVSTDNNFITSVVKIPHGYQIKYHPSYQYLKSDSSKIRLGEPILSGGDSIKGYLEFKNRMEIKREITANFLKNSDSVKLFVGFQMCTKDGTCLFPVEREANVLIIPREASNFNYSTLFKFLIFALLGGIVLNIMPCVLPVLSIKAMSLVKQAGEDRKSIFKHSMAYTLGVMISFWILAGVVIFLKISGESVGWGFQFQSPSFVFFLLLVIFVFALSMFDIITFHPPLSSAGKLTMQKGLMGSVFSGVFAVLLATPCTAPMLGPAIGFAFSQPSLVIFLIFSLIGFGLAFPFFLLGFFPSIVQKLPKPGEWMNNFKIVMGFLLIATVIFLFRSLYFLIGGKNSISVLWFLLIVSFFVWVYGKNYTPYQSFKRKFLLLVLFIPSLFFIGNSIISFEKIDNECSTSKYPGWKTFDQDSVLNNIKSGKKVFIDFTAEWCMTCQTNKITVLHTQKIMDLFNNNNVLLYYADNTNKNETISQWLKKYNRAGVPLYLYFDGSMEEVTIFPEILTEDMLIREIVDDNIKDNRWSL